MFKGKKVLVTSIALGTILFTSTIGQAANYRYNYKSNNYKHNWQVVRYNNYNSRYNYGGYNKPSQPSQNTGINTPTVPNTSVSQAEQEVLRLVNIERQNAGLSPFTLSMGLSQVAKEKSKDMATKNYFSHTSPTYGSIFDMLRSNGISYSTAGENIAKGYSSAESVVRGWMNSPGHRANILNPSFRSIGIGSYNGGGSTYWTQVFTN